MCPVVMWSEIDPTWMPDTRKQKEGVPGAAGKGSRSPTSKEGSACPHSSLSAVLVKAVQGAESCPDPPKATAEAGTRRRCQVCPLC